MTQRILVLFISVLSCLVLSLAPQGCGNGKVQRCTNDSDCQADEFCQDGKCVARQDGGGGDDDDLTCSTADDCPEGQGCLAAEGVCGSCRAAGECREGEACIDGVCGGCQTSMDCNGHLCTEGECVPCRSPDDDQRCRNEYGDPDYSCQDDGNCGPETCASGVDCQLNGQVCSTEGRCVDCEDTYDCLDDQMGGYPNGTLCIDGVCVEGECIQSADCPDDEPICGEDFRCRGCQTHVECREREGAVDGFVCDWDTGLCHAGNCHPPGSACGAAGDLVCSDEYACRPCQDDAECVAANGGVERFICEEGHCVLGCQNAFGCTQGQVCRNNRCSSCNDDNECKEAYGDSRQICEAGLCELGCVPDTLNADGIVCGDDNRWRSCVGDSECQTISGLPHYFCDAGGHCVAGECATNAQCSHLDDLPCTEGVCDGYVCRVNYRNGVSCSDGDFCTQTDTCQSGSCVGSNPVQCTPLDQCHDAGVCEPQTGLCSNPAKSDGTPCNDNDLCTQTDACQSGICVGSNQVVCTITGAELCVLSKTCDPNTGACVPTYKSSSAICQYEAEVDIACPDGTGCGMDLRKRTRDRYCSGNSAGCDGSLGSWSSWSLYTACANWESCDAASDTCVDTRVAIRWWLCNPGEVYDSLNDLSWKRTPRCCYSSQGAIDYCNGLGNGWRLPNINELRMIIKGCPGTETGGACAVVDPGCLGSGCSSPGDCYCDFDGGPGEGGCYWEPGVWNGGCGWYWSSSPEAVDPSSAWGVNFAAGLVGYGEMGGVGVRCVRSGS